jgi:hypothetical protein
LVLYYAEIVRTILAVSVFGLLSLLSLGGCSSAPPPVANRAGGPPIATSVIAAGHPMAKYLELVGFRLAEKGAGKLTVKFAVVNHSEADIGDLNMRIRLTTTAAKPDDPPIVEFDAKAPQLGPQEMKEVTAAGATKLRIYELPDWQFIRANVEITSK